MYHIYTTPSIILHREPSGDSAYYCLLTKDLGLIYARAQGVRGVKSRLKGALQEFSYSTVAFVHGKAGWKITTAIPERNFFTETKDTQVRKILAHISNTLIRLIPGEEKSPLIFSIIEKGFIQLVEGCFDSSSIEVLILARLLHLLGYLASDTITALLFENYSDFSDPLLSHTTIHKTVIIRTINTGLKESQL